MVKTSCMECLDWIPRLLILGSLLFQPLGGSGDDFRSWVCATHVATTENETPPPVTTIMGIWGMSQQMGMVSLSLSHDFLSKQKESPYYSEKLHHSHQAGVQVVLVNSMSFLTTFMTLPHPNACSIFIVSTKPPSFLFAILFFSRLAN